MLPELSEKSVNIGNLAEKALEDKELLAELLGGLKSKEETLRYNCSRVLLLQSESHGEMLYPKWYYLVELLNSENTYRKMSALQIIANLTGYDTENRFEKIFDRYYSLLDEERTSLAAHIAGNSGKIARAKPGLQAKITDKLLNIDKTSRSKQKELVKGYAITAFGEYFAETAGKDKILEFVREQQNSRSPKTRKLAEEFLKKWS